MLRTLVLLLPFVSASAFSMDLQAQQDVRLSKRIYYHNQQSDSMDCSISSASSSGQSYRLVIGKKISGISTTTVSEIMIAQDLTVLIDGAAREKLYRTNSYIHAIDSYYSSEYYLADGTHVSAQLSETHSTHVNGENQIVENPTPQAKTLMALLDSYCPKL